MSVLKEVKILKKIGDTNIEIGEILKFDMESKTTQDYLKNGYIKLVISNTQAKKKSKKKNNTPDYKISSREVLKLVGKDLAKQTAGIEKLCKKYFVGKTFLNKIVSNEELIIKRENKLTKKQEIEKVKEEEKIKIKKEKQEIKDKELKEKADIKLKIQLDKDKEKEIRESEKQRIKQEKEDNKKQKELEVEVQKEIDKSKILELETNWENCNDELFTEVMEKDFKKAQHYFTQRLMHDYHFKVFDDNEEIIIYCDSGEKEGEYKQDGDKIIETICENRLGEKSTIVSAREIISKIQRIDKLKISRDSIFKNDDEIIIVKNGILNMKTKEISPFTPDKVFLNKSNAAYNPNAKCPIWMSFLNTSLLNKPKEIATIQEYSGYTISNDNNKQKGFIGYGAGATGQSTMQNVVSFLIGKESITNLSVQDIEHDTFATAMLFGKKANMNPDLPKKALGESSKVKKIIRGEDVFVQKKGKDGYSMKPTIKLWFGCNQIPTTADHSDGFFRSWLVIHFEEQFLEGDPRRIENLTDKICSSEEEMSGVLNWAIDGYNRLQENKQFSKCFSIQEVKDFWLENSDTVSSFYKKLIVMNHEEKEIKEEVYNTYVLYCEKMNKPAEEHNVFFKRLKNVCDYKEFSPSSLANDRRRRLLGIKLLPLSSLNIDTNKEVTHN